MERWNLLSNPSWDSGDYSGWEIYNQTGSLSTITVRPNTVRQRWRTPLGYNYFLEVTIPAASAVSIGNFNLIPVNLNDDYQLVVWADGGTPAVRLHLMAKYYTSGLIHLETQYNTFTGSWSWSSLMGASVPPPNAAYARYAVRLENTDTVSRIVRLDDAAFMPVNSPLNIGWWSWNNAAGEYDFLPSENILRIYILHAFNTGSSNSLVRIMPASGVIANTIAAVKVPPSPHGETVVYNPPVYFGRRPYPTLRHRIENVAATGGTVYAVAYFNAMNQWTTGDL